MSSSTADPNTFPSHQPAKVLVIGQVPPPLHGQALMTQRLINAPMKRIRIYHIRMAFSKSMSSVGRFSLGKVGHMLSITAQGIYCRVRYGINTLYYMPAGPDLVPVIRDIFILAVLRLFYRRTIFHFRAAGVSEFVAQQSLIVRKVAYWVYHRPELAIHLAAINPDDGGYFKAKKKVVINNGLEDAATPYLPIQRSDADGATRILYIGLISESKGVMVFLEALVLLRAQGYHVQADIVGGFSGKDFQQKVEHYCQEHQLNEIITFPGEKRAPEKWEYFLNNDMLCFPTFYEPESMGNVLIEAMMFEMPVVSTQWRGIPEVVDHGQTGWLAPIQDAPAIAEYLSLLIKDPALRKQMGQAGRQKFLDRFQLPRFLENMEEALYTVAKD